MGNRKHLDHDSGIADASRTMSRRRRELNAESAWNGITSSSDGRMRGLVRRREALFADRPVRGGASWPEGGRGTVQWVSGRVYAGPAAILNPGMPPQR